MKTTKFMIHKVTDDIFAVTMKRGKVVGASGPLSKMSAQEKLLPYFSYLKGLGSLVQGQIDQFTTYEPTECKEVV